MKNPRIPWSWLAFVAALLVLGFVQVFGLFFIQGFRRGLDADMEWAMQGMTVFEMLFIAVSIAVLAVPVFLIARWVANKTVRPQLIFPLATILPPFLAMVGLRAWYLIGWQLEQPSPVIAFEQDQLFYLPNWLELAFIVIAFGVASAVYVRLSRHYSVPKAHDRRT